jgi:putative sigma-54 modulation protein
MQINFTGHNVEVTPALKSYTEDKFGKLERHFDKITAINVVFNVEKLVQTAEATILVAKGDLHASAKSENMYTAIDELMDKLDRQLIKHKEKLRGHD